MATILKKGEKPVEKKKNPTWRDSEFWRTAPFDFGITPKQYAKEDLKANEPVLAGDYPKNPDPSIPQAVWEEACRIAWNREGVRDKNVVVLEEDIEKAYKITKSHGNFGVERRPEASASAASVVTVPGSSSFVVPMDTSGSAKPSPVQTKSSTGEQISGNPESTDPGAASLVDKLPEQKPYSNVLEEEDAGVDRLLEQYKATGTEQKAETDYERRLREEEEERRKWEKYQSVADMLTALGVVASAANNRQGAGRFDIVSAQMFQGPGRMNLVQAGQGFRLGPYIRRG